MTKIAYIDKQFRDTTLTVINQANDIVREYWAQGYSLTLRQLYYQMVARALIPNNVRSYKRLGAILTDARLAGLVDWEAIEDRTRSLAGNSHWQTPQKIVETAVQSYQIDKWADQPHRVEVWVEKDALASVIAQACRPLDVDHFSCRGYTSASEMWRAGRRLRQYLAHGQVPVILHLGDHDPSGVDMTRDIAERLALFAEEEIIVERIALNMDQIEAYAPPPNPAKLTDSRANGYIAEFGRESWELDALEPRALTALIQRSVLQYRDEALWRAAVEKETAHKALLQNAAASLGDMLSEV